MSVFVLNVEHLSGRRYIPFKSLGLISGDRLIVNFYFTRNWGKYIENSIQYSVGERAIQVWLGEIQRYIGINNSM